MLKSLKIISLFAITSASFNLFAQDAIDIPWTGTPGEVEAAVAANGGHGRFKLEDGKVYLMLDHIPVQSYKRVVLMGSGSTDMHPATIQPTPNAEGVVSLTDGQFFNLVGYKAEVQLHDLIINCMAVNEGGQVGVAAARADINKIVVNNCFISGMNTLAFHTMGTGTDFHIRNSIFDGWTSYPGGAFYGGAIWGGGSWMGTMDTLVFENNTVHGVIGEAIVAYSYTDAGSRINQNTFANISMGALYTYTANNLQITNNLFYNTRAYGQSTNDITGWGVVWPGYVGQLATRQNYIGTPDSTDGAQTGYYTMGDGQQVSFVDRNQAWSNNAVVWSPALVDWMTNMAANPWSWTTTDADGNEVTTIDTMASVEIQARVHSDTALAAVAADIGITSTMNALLTSDDLGSNIAEEYITAQLARTLDFRDNQATDGIAATHEWVYQNNGSHIVVEWPWHLDVSYSTSSAAYTHSTDGMPVGNLNAFPDKKAEWEAIYGLATDSDKSNLAPSKFSLDQNYPNPFNPSTEIAYTLDQTSNISLTIYNALGQKVRVLENSYKQSGTHTAKWDGRDEFGATVSTGLYFYTLSDGTSSFTKKMALMK